MMCVLCLHLNFLVLMTMFSSTRSPATTATSTTSSSSVTRLTSAHILPRCHREGVCVTIYFCDYDYVTKRCHCRRWRLCDYTFNICVTMKL